MTPDEFRKKYKSCYTCKYYSRNIVFEKFSKCEVRNVEVNSSTARKCECYTPIPFYEKQESETGIGLE